MIVDSAIFHSFYNKKQNCVFANLWISSKMKKPALDEEVSEFVSVRFQLYLLRNDEMRVGESIELITVLCFNTVQN